jgi:hypothetical protein
MPIQRLSRKPSTFPLSSLSCVGMVLMWFGGSRKATLKAHPDKEGGTQEKMAAVNEAYEVLFNPGASPPFPPVGIY